MEKKKDSNVALGIVGTVTSLYGIWCVADITVNPSENEKLDNVYKNIGIFDILLGLGEIVIAFNRERKERKAKKES